MLIIYNIKFLLFLSVGRLYAFFQYDTVNW